MKIGFINQSQIGYGAWETTINLIKEAKNRGHETYLNEYRDDLDFYVIGMFYDSDGVAKIIKNKPYVYIEHSIEMILHEKEIIRKHILPNAKKIYFFSPRQRENILYNLNSASQKIIENNHAYLVVPIDTEFWKAIDIEREFNLNIFVGLIHSNKGVCQILQEAKQKPNQKFVFIGSGGGDIDVNTFINGYPNCQYIGHQNKEQLREWYSRASNLYILASNGAVESASRVVFEAVLCGCNPIVNKNVGNSSYPWYNDRSKIIENIKESINNFYCFIESAK